MKYFALLILLFCASQTNAKPVQDTLKVQTRIYCDHCMECESCWPRMKHDLHFTTGVKELSFDSATMVITVVYNPAKTSPEKIRKAITKAGFDADNVPADPGAQKRLDGCCKKQE